MKEEQAMKTIIRTLEAIDGIYQASIEGKEHDYKWEITERFYDDVGWEEQIWGLDLDPILELADNIGSSSFASPENNQTIQQLKELAWVIIMRALNRECDPFENNRVPAKHDDIEDEESEDDE